MSLLSGTQGGRGTRGRSPVRWRPRAGRPHTSTVQRGSPPGCADATMDILGFLRVSSWKDIEVRGGATGTAARSQGWAHRHCRALGRERGQHTAPHAGASQESFGRTPRRGGLGSQSPGI